MCVCVFVSTSVHFQDFRDILFLVCFLVLQSELVCNQMWNQSKRFFWGGGKEGCDPAELWVLHPIFSRTAAAWVELTPLKLSQEYWDHFVQFCHVISMCEHIKCNALCREFCILRLSNISIQFQTDMINSWLVFPFPDVYFYSREYGNDSSHSRAPGNDEYYEGLMTKNLLTTCYTQVLLIFINYKEDEKQWNYVGKVVSYPQWQVHITEHSAQAVMSVVSSECLRNGGPDEKLELKNTWSRLP